ncbi:MAG: hypothetical protein AAFY55_13085 [Bacteroidota bacterium]
MRRPTLLARLATFTIAVCVMAGAVTLGGCQAATESTTASPNPMDKMDAALRQQIAAAAPDTTLDAFVLVEGITADDARSQIADAGLTIRMVSGTILTVAGQPDALRRAAAFPWVQRMEGSLSRPAYGS